MCAYIAPTLILMSWKSLSMAPIFCASLILKILMHAAFTVSWIHSVLKNMFSFELIPTKGKLVSWVFVLHLFGNAKKKKIVSFWWSSVNDIYVLEKYTCTYKYFGLNLYTNYNNWAVSWCFHETLIMNRGLTSNLCYMMYICIRSSNLTVLNPIMCRQTSVTLQR